MFRLRSKQATDHSTATVAARAVTRTLVGIVEIMRATNEGSRRKLQIVTLSCCMYLPTVSSTGCVSRSLSPILAAHTCAASSQKLYEKSC